MSINMPSKEFYIHSLITGLVFLSSYLYFINANSYKVKRTENVSCIVISIKPCVSSPNIQLSDSVRNKKTCYLEIYLKNKTREGNTKPPLLDTINQISTLSFGKSDSNIILLIISIIAYIIGLAISLISQLTMDIIFKFNPKKLEEAVCPFQEEKTIKLDFDSEENVTYSGSELFYSLGNFFLSISLSTFFGFLYTKYQQIDIIILLIMTISILLLTCIYCIELRILSYITIIAIFALILFSPSPISLKLITILCTALALLLRIYGNHLIYHLQQNKKDKIS